VLRSDETSSSAGSVGRGALAFLFLGVSLGGTVCTFGCDTPYNVISAVSVVGALIGALMLCGATPGCHD